MSTNTAKTVTPTDRIEKEVILRASRSRVWRALTDSGEFGSWFGCRFAGSFAPGARVAGTMVDPPGMEHLEWDVLVERIEPEELFSFRWHPGADGPSSPDDPRTLVTFTLEEVPGGTRLTLVEEGFDRLAPELRARAFSDNEQGWEEQMRRIARHVESA